MCNWEAVKNFSKPKQTNTNLQREQATALLALQGHQEIKKNMLLLWDTLIFLRAE